MFLSAAYSRALKGMGQGKSWAACCEETVIFLREAGIHVCEAKTLMTWNRDFRKHECFRHLNQYVATGIKPEPYLFELFPEAKGRLLSFATANLGSFSLEKIKVYFDGTLFPSLLKQFNEDLDESDHFDMTDFLKMLGSTDSTPHRIVDRSSRLFRTLQYTFL